jgi:glycine dehydrogenase subunit 2
MHEFVLSARTLKREHGVSALDVAKRLMDTAHPPTICFPLIVPEALMVEPTRAEETLDAFVRRCSRLREAAGTPKR